MTTPTFVNYRVLASRSFLSTVASVNPALPENLIKALSNNADQFCTAVKDTAIKDIEFSIPLHNLRMIVMSMLATDPAHTQLPSYGQFLSDISRSMTICCTVTPKINCFNVVIDMLPTHVTDNVSKHFTNFVASETQLNPIH